ncbi:hypothetical protein M8J76_007422 [Diaphorina citri]|nr:hypothetical protein M8J76_007422 [Diaphorina citri]
MLLKFNGLQTSFIFSMGLIFHLGNAAPQYSKSVNGHALERSPGFSDPAEGFPEYLNIFKQLTDNSHLASRNTPALRTKFDPKSLRVSRVAEAPTRPPPLDPMEQMRLQQEYADRTIREQQELALGLGRSKPKSPGAPAPPSGAAGLFKPFPIYYNKDPAVAHFSGANFDPAANNYDEDSLESEEVSRYQRPIRPVPKKSHSSLFNPKTKPSYAYDERYFR